MHRLLLFLLVIVSVLTVVTSTAQSSPGQLSLDQLIKTKDLDKQTVYTELSDRYPGIAPADQLLVARKLASLSYSLVKPSVATWFAKADSLAQTSSSQPYDHIYELTKISWYHATKRTAEAIELLDVMEPLALASSDTSWQIAYYVKRVRAYAVFDDMAKALKYQLAAEELNEAYGGLVQEGHLYVGRAAIAWENMDIVGSLDYEMKAIEIYEEVDHSNLSISYQNAIVLARKLDNLDLAAELMARQSRYKLKTGCQRCYFSEELNRILFLIESEKYSEAIVLADQTIVYADTMGRDKSHAIYLKGVAHRGIDRYDIAADYIEEAFEIGKDKRHMGKCAFYSHALYQTYYWDDQFEPALEWYQIHTSYRDSVYNEEKAKEIGVLEARLESLEQKRKVAELEGKVQVDRQRKRALWITLLLGGLLAVSLLYAQRQRSSRKDAIQKALLLESLAEQEKLQQRLEFNEKELATQILNITQKNNLLQDLMAQIETLQNNDNQRSVSRLVRNIKRNVENSEEWEHFLSTFRSIHSNYLKKLNSLADNLTSSEIRLASLMKMNLSSKEIASMLNISDEGVKKARYRLRKKLGLDSSINMQDYLLRLT